MGPFPPLFSIDVEHDFFSDGFWRVVRFVPAPESQALIDSAGFLIRHTPNGIALYYDRSRTESLALFLDDADGKLGFGFKVYVDDDVFKNYSEAFLASPGALAYCRSDRGAQDGERIRLHQEERVSQQDMEPIDSVELEGLLGSWDLHVPPAFAVQVTLPSVVGGTVEEFLESAPTRWFLKFGARQTYWTYFLLGPFANRRVNVVDLDEGMGFEPLGTVLLSDERPALAFRSEAAIGMRQRPANRFQLRESGSGNGKVLVKRLPVAAASQVNRQTLGGKVVAVSEIYVNG
jgi:hypothetical protein